MAVFGAVVILLWWPVAAPATQGPCPPELREAAEAYRTSLAEEQKTIRASTLESPRGIEETVQFDLGAHACHRGPGQAHREYGEPACVSGEDDRHAPVRYPYRLFFRKALTLEELFSKGWERGSDGILEVEFEREGERWVPVSRREVLDLKTSQGHPGMEADRTTPKP